MFRGFIVKKGFVALLLGLALVVLVSPGIVGRLAERSMDENLDWAATESQKVVVTSQGFDRGWFSSAGQHRVEIRDGELQQLLLALTGAGNASELPALIIDTRLDHGLIPLASMSRDKGTLMPGLGSAISSVSIELADGEIIQMPGTIYSDVNLTGALRSEFILATGSHELEGADAEWGDIAIEIVTNPATGTIELDGTLASVSLAADDEFFRVGEIEFTGKQRRSRFGFWVGDADFMMQAMTFKNDLDNPTSFGPLTIGSTSAVDGGRVSGRATIKLENMPAAEFGAAGISADINLIEVDGAALGQITDALNQMQKGGSAEDFRFVVENDLRRLLSAGFELRIDQLDVSLPQGVINSKFRFLVEETDSDTFVWTSVLLALDASAELRMPVELVELMTEMDPQMHSAIGMGFLRKNGDFYEMEATFKKGLLTVNGAPMPIPIPGIQ